MAVTLPIRIFLMAKIWPVSLSYRMEGKMSLRPMPRQKSNNNSDVQYLFRTLYTTPKVPSPIFRSFSYLSVDILYEWNEIESTFPVCSVNSLLRISTQTSIALATYLLGSPLMTQISTISFWCSVLQGSEARSDHLCDPRHFFDLDSDSRPSRLKSLRQNFASESSEFRFEKCEIDSAGIPHMESIDYTSLHVLQHAVDVCLPQSDKENIFFGVLSETHWELLSSWPDIFAQL